MVAAATRYFNCNVLLVPKNITFGSLRPLRFLLADVTVCQDKNYCADRLNCNP